MSSFSEHAHDVPGFLSAYPPYTTAEEARAVGPMPALEYPQGKEKLGANACRPVIDTVTGYLAVPCMSGDTPGGLHIIDLEGTDMSQGVAAPRDSASSSAEDFVESRAKLVLQVKVNDCRSVVFWPTSDTFGTGKQVKNISEKKLKALRDQRTAIPNLDIRRFSVVESQTSSIVVFDAASDFSAVIPVFQMDHEGNTRVVPTTVSRPRLTFDCPQDHKLWIRSNDDRRHLVACDGARDQLVVVEIETLVRFEEPDKKSFQLPSRIIKVAGGTLGWAWSCAVGQTDNAFAGCDRGVAEVNLLSGETVRYFEDAGIRGCYGSALIYSQGYLLSTLNTETTINVWNTALDSPPPSPLSALSRVVAINPSNPISSFGLNLQRGRLVTVSSSPTSSIAVYELGSGNMIKSSLKR